MTRLQKLSRTFLAAAGLSAAVATTLGMGVPSYADTDESALQGEPTLQGSAMRRLTEAQYRASIADIFGPDIKVIGRFEPDLRVDGLLAVGTSAVSITPGGIEQYEEIARTIATQVTDKDHREELIGCAQGPADPDGVQCARAFLQSVGLRLYRRPLTVREVQDFVALTTLASRQLGDFYAGLASSLTAMLTSPDFLFRMYMPGKNGGIDGYSKATRLSFFLWNTSPDAALLAAAADGRLDSPQGLANEVDRLIASPRFVEGARAFFDDYLQLDTMDALTKDALIYPAFSSSIAATSREQTLRTVTDLLIARNGDFRDLFTTRRFAMNRALGPIYNIPVTKDGWYIHEFPDGDPRIGLLTQASLLALHSHPGRTSPTLRGKAIQESLMCTKVPSPPANVNFAVVQDVDNTTLKTTRARLQAHVNDEECASCHRAMDPAGLGLEHFDGAGQYRATEHGEPIDVTGTFEKKAFRSAVELGRLFHDSPRVTSCLVNTAWRYANGRQVAESDEPEIESLTRRFEASGYRFAALLRSIALDPGFYRLPGSVRTSSPHIARQQQSNGS